MFPRLATKKPNTAEILKSNVYFSLAIRILKGKPVQVNDLAGTIFEGQQPELVDSSQLRVELYREAIANNPNAYAAITNLAICISQGVTTLKSDDLKNTRFEYTPLHEVNFNEAIADLYRNSIKINPSHTMAICNLASCFQRGAIPLQTDFLGTKFERKSLKDIHIEELIIALHRKARRLNPKDPIAAYMVATALFNGAQAEEEDLLLTVLQGQSLENINELELIAELLRSFIEVNSDTFHSIYGEALYMLASCLLSGVPVSHRDIFHTGFNQASPENTDPIQIAIALYSEILELHPNHIGARIQLSSCEALLRAEPKLPEILESKSCYAPRYKNLRIETPENTHSIPILEDTSKKTANNNLS